MNLIRSLVPPSAFEKSLACFSCLSAVAESLTSCAAWSEERGLDALFRFLPYQDRLTLKYLLGAADVHLVSLKPELEGLMVPSKFYGIAAAGRPVIAVTAPDGEVADLVRRYGCGIVIEPGQGDVLAEHLLRLINSAPSLADMGSRARAMLDAHFTRRQAFARWTSLLESIGHWPSDLPLQSGMLPSALPLDLSISSTSWRAAVSGPPALSGSP